MPLVDCKQCEELSANTPWGTHTDPPIGFCHAKIIYVWKIPKQCTRFKGEHDKSGVK